MFNLIRILTLNVLSKNNSRRLFEHFFFSKKLHFDISCELEKFCKECPSIFSVENKESYQ